MVSLKLTEDTLSIPPSKITQIVDPNPLYSPGRVQKWSSVCETKTHQGSADDWSMSSQNVVQLHPPFLKKEISTPITGQEKTFNRYQLYDVLANFVKIWQTGATNNWPKSRTIYNGLEGKRPASQKLKLLWNSRNIYLYESRDVAVNWRWPRLPVYKSGVRGIS